MAAARHRNSGHSALGHFRHKRLSSIDKRPFRQSRVCIAELLDPSTVAGTTPRCTTPRGRLLQQTHKKKEAANTP